MEQDQSSDMMASKPSCGLSTTRRTGQQRGWPPGPGADFLPALRGSGRGEEQAGLATAVANKLLPGSMSVLSGHPSPHGTCPFAALVKRGHLVPVRADRRWHILISSAQKLENLG